jgi:hypothetical protein
VDGVHGDRWAQEGGWLRSRRAAVVTLAGGALTLLSRRRATAQSTGGAPCNQVTCGAGEYCCNASCSRCVPIGQGCTRELCLPTPARGSQCGPTTTAATPAAARACLPPAGGDRCDGDVCGE